MCAVQKCKPDWMIELRMLVGGMAASTHLLVGH